MGQCLPPGVCGGDGDCLPGLYCASDDSCRVVGTCLIDDDCGGLDRCISQVCYRGCDGQEDCFVGEHCGDAGLCEPDDCSALDCAAQHRSCDAVEIECGACLAGYHEVDTACVPDDCTSLGCADENRTCDTGGGAPACGGCLPGYTEDGEGQCRQCELRADCPAGHYCSEQGSCEQDCTPPATPAEIVPCAPGGDTDQQRCMPDGRCVYVTPGGSVCAAAVEQGDIREPTVMLLLDQSGSMSDCYPCSGSSCDFDTGTDCEADPVSRWDSLGDALFDSVADGDAEDGVLVSLAPQINFGLSLYTNDQAGSCPDIERTTSVEVDYFDDMKTLYEANGPSSYTPTGDSIDAVRTYMVDNPDTLPALDPVNDLYILLATDGEPNRCESTSTPSNRAKAESVAAARAAYDAGIHLFMLSVGADVAQWHMQHVANAGAGVCACTGSDDAHCNTPDASATGHIGSCFCGGTSGSAPLCGSGEPTGVCSCDEDVPYYQATNPTELRSQLSGIFTSVLSCVVTLGASSQPLEGDVYLDGDPVPLDATNGYVFIGPTAIELRGTSCDKVKSDGQHYIVAQFYLCDSGG